MKVNVSKEITSKQQNYILLISLLGLIHLILDINPFAPEPPVQIQVLSTLCDVISFNGQGQLSSLTCAE